MSADDLAQHLPWIKRDTQIITANLSIKGFLLLNSCVCISEGQEAEQVHPNTHSQKQAKVGNHRG